jgi:4-amino-4-deoxychorismate lyase
MESPVRAMVNAPRVIETLAWDGQQCVRLARHLARLQRTCAQLGYRLDRALVQQHLAALPTGQALRVRLTVGAMGDIELTHAPLAPTASVWRLGLATQTLQSDDDWLRIKTTERALYDQVRANLPAGLDEMIFCNQRGEVCEGTITNVFFDVGQGLCTPPTDCGLLPGVLREEMLASGACKEQVLPRALLPQARLWVGNSLRGLIAVAWVTL